MSSNRQKLITEFINITGADQGTAKHFLDACSDNLETAVAMFLDSKTEHPISTGASNSTTGEDEVRAPIPQTTGVLVEDPHYMTTSRDRWSARRRPRSVFDGFRDFKAETTRQESLLSSDPNKDHRLKRLEDLFRPPLELMHRGTLETAREAGRQAYKWLMINVQNAREFSCQVLNRDVWSKPNVQRLIKAHFVFWQVYNDSTEGDRFTQFYPVTTWPHVSILDPRTGERLSMWNDIKVNNIEGKVEEFLADHGTIGEDEKDDPEPPSKKTKVDHSLIDDSEDTQLAAAIAASLKQTKTTSNNINADSFMISNESSDVSEFEGSSDEATLIEDGDSGDSDVKISKKKHNSIKNGSMAETKIDEDFFGEKQPENSSNGEKISKNNSMTLNSNGSSTKLFDKKLYKKVNSRLKVGTVENRKDMSKLTNDIFGGESKKVIPPQNEINMDEICRIMVRFPDGSREEIKMAVNMTVKDLSSELTKKGYSPNDYDVVTNFPRKSIFSSGPEKTLKEAGLFPRAAVFVQEIES